MKKKSFSMRSLIHGTSYTFLVISGIQLFLMVFITTYGVIMRYIFKSPEPISYELCTIFLLWSFTFAMPEVEWLDQHIAADIFIQFAPKRIGKFLKKIITPIFGIIFCVVLTWKGWTVSMYSYKIHELSPSVLAEPIFLVKLMIPICYFLVSIVLIDKLIHNIRAYDVDEPEKEKLYI